MFICLEIGTTTLKLVYNTTSLHILYMLNVHRPTYLHISYGSTNSELLLIVYYASAYSQPHQTNS